MPYGYPGSGIDPTPPVVVVAETCEGYVVVQPASAVLTITVAPATAADAFALTTRTLIEGTRIFGLGV